MLNFSSRKCDLFIEHPLKLLYLLSSSSRGFHLFIVQRHLASDGGSSFSFYNCTNSCGEHGRHLPLLSVTLEQVPPTLEQSSPTLAVKVAHTFASDLFAATAGDRCRRHIRSPAASVRQRWRQSRQYRCQFSRVPVTVELSKTLRRQSR